MDNPADAPVSPLSGSPPPADPPLRKIIVAIHGIGSQRRSDTIRSVARRFGDRSRPPLPVMPLGFFHIATGGNVHVSRLDADPGSPLREIGFAEVFWADIPRQVVKEDDTLDETKAWGASVVSRAQAMYDRRVTGRQELDHADFALGSAVIEEIVETVAVLENLFTVTEKMGIFKFDLAPLLRDYIGDVQLVTDFDFYRRRIVARFHRTMAQIAARYREQYPGQAPEIYIVAHSEGTVVSFLGLLQALSGGPVTDPDSADGVPIATDWIRDVRGFMTIGSPIDKHIVLWPRLWEGLDLESRDTGGKVVFNPGRGDGLELPRRIAWRNYYDFGDPIGFRLETAAEFLADRGCEAFDFTSTPGKDDFGFSRYLLPGKAHNDYWGDADVFGHFIDDVVMPTGKPAVAPPSSAAVGIVSTAIPYLLALALHILAVFLLYKGAAAFFSGGHSPGTGQTIAAVLLLGVLLAGVTIAARLPHLVKTSGLRWHAVALLVFVAAATPTWFWLPTDIAEFLGPKLISAVGASTRPAIFTFLAIALVIAASGWIAHSKPRIARRALIGCGAVLVLGIVAIRLWAAESDQSQWPVFLAGAAFLYLWWLGVLFFDLAFIWHRYIRNAVAVHTLSEWHRGRDAWPRYTLRKKPGGADKPPETAAA